MLVAVVVAATYSNADLSEIHPLPQKPARFIRIDLLMLNILVNESCLESNGELHVLKCALSLVVQ